MNDPTVSMTQKEEWEVAVLVKLTILAYNGSIAVEVDDDKTPWFSSKNSRLHRTLRIS